MLPYHCISYTCQLNVQVGRGRGWREVTGKCCPITVSVILVNIQVGRERRWRGFTGKCCPITVSVILVNETCR